MALYRRRRPAPIQVFTTREKRQAAGLGAVGPGSEGEQEEPEGPESPDSPGSSLSTIGASSPGNSSDSEEDEPPSPKESSSSSPSKVSSTSAATSAPPSLPSSTVAQLPAMVSPPIQTSSKAVLPSSSSSSSSTSSQAATSTSTSTSLQPFTIAPTTQGIAAVAPLPLPTDRTRTTVVTSIRPTSTGSLAAPDSPESPDSPDSPKSPKSPASTASSSATLPSSSQIFSSKIARPTLSASATVSVLPPPPTNVTGVPVGDNDPPRRTRPQPTIMSKGAEAAAITLSIIGAIALAVGILLYCKRRRRRQNEKLEAELERDAANHAALQRPETAHVNTTHMTQSSDRSNTLFGPSSYSRPETVSARDGSRIPMPQPTPNPFADPPLNKAYDVLNNRPRSTTLTDRGSWIKNPFKDPESERFDPFGELQAKARRERIKQVELARREAELERHFEEKEKMGLRPPERAVDRKGSGVTLEGLGVLDRSGGGAYR